MNETRPGIIGAVPALTQETLLAGTATDLGKIEPEAGMTFRRDPLDLPLLEAERWTEWVVSVELNGRVVSEGTIVIEDPSTGRLAIERSTAEAWRLLFRPADLITFEGLPFLPLDTIPDTTGDLERSTLTLKLTVPPATFDRYSLDVRDEPSPIPVPGSGGFFDYDLLATGGGGVEDDLAGLLEAGLFGRGAVFITNANVDGLGREPSARRLDTTLFKDFPDRRATLRIGDTLGLAGSFAQGVRFGGIQWSTNFATDPSFVTFPLPSIGGLAEQESVVDVIVDNLSRATETVPPGPFSIDNIPVVTGAGEVQIRVTDLLGRERLVTQSYYVSQRLLRAGLHDFSYELGLEREDYGSASFDYGSILGSVTHRYGFTDGVTGELHLELESDRASIVTGGALSLGALGLVTGGAGASTERDIGEGMIAELAYEYQARPFSLGARTRLTTDDFRQAGGDTGAFRRIDQANIGFDARRLGRLGLLFINRQRIDGPDDRSLTGSYSLPIRRGSLLVNVGRTIAPDRAFAVTAALSFQIAPDRSLSTIGERRDGSTRGRLQYTHGRGASEIGLDYRIASEIGDDSRPLDARLAYQATKVGTELNLERADGDDRGRLGANGSIALVDGMLGATRRVGRAFGLVDLPGFPNVRVYLDNRIAGTTDDQGRLLLPNLRPYEANRVRLAVEDLPIDARIGDDELAAVPFDRSGMRIDFGIVAVQRATVVLVDRSGKPLPAGLSLASRDGKATALVGRHGFTEVSGDLGTPAMLLGETGDDAVRCHLDPVSGDDPLPDLGVIACTS